MLVALDNLIDPATGTIELRAAFANADGSCTRTSSSTPGC